MNPTIGALCANYLTDYPKTSGSKRNILERLQGEKIGKVEAPGTSKHFIDFARLRRQDVAPATVLMDIIYLRGVLAYAKPGWGLANVTDAPIREAFPVLRKEGLIGASRRRTRAPTPEEARGIFAYLRERDPLKADVVDFQDYSSRRISETCRLQWGDLDGKTILVRDMKHPRHKTGNNKLVALPDEAFAIIMRQPRRTTKPEERIFKISASAVKSAFQRACAALGYIDLHLHDFRRGTVTRLLAEGRSVQEVMLVTGQVTAGMVLTTYNALKAADFHKPRAA
jgi:integrase